MGSWYSYEWKLQEVQIGLKFKNKNMRYSVHIFIYKTTLLFVNLQHNTSTISKEIPWQKCGDTDTEMDRVFQYRYKEA